MTDLVLSPFLQRNANRPIVILSSNDFLLSLSSTVRGTSYTFVGGRIVCRTPKPNESVSSLFIIKLQVALVVIQPVFNASSNNSTVTRDITVSMGKCKNSDDLTNQSIFSRCYFI